MPLVFCCILFITYNFLTLLIFVLGIYVSLVQFPMMIQVSKGVKIKFTCQNAQIICNEELYGLLVTRFLQV